MTDTEAAELSVIGAALLTNGTILDDLDLAPGDYHSPAHEFIHRTMLEMRGTRKPVDLVTVSNAIAKSGERIDPMILHKAASVTASPASAEFYAAIITEAATLRRLKTAAMRINTLTDSGGDADEILEAARREVDAAQSSAKSSPVRFVAETLEGTINALDSKVESHPTPWASLNEIITGLKPGALYVVGARPSVGKSVVGLQLGRELTKHGAVAMMSLEMSVDDVNTRLIASELHIDMHRLVSRQLTPGDWSRIGEWLGGRADMPLAVNDHSGATITDIKRFARSVNRRKPLAGIVVDYLQLMNQPRGDKRPRHEFVADMSRQLKILAMDMHVPVIALSQLNRGSENRDDKRPKLSDLRESGAVEQDADVVLLLHREIMGDTKNDIDILVAKNRHGATGHVRLQFAGHYSEIRDT
ncbi:DnaB-like helicase C-terminal domain-containing protein [Pseudarthrobacter phenanthrenivorans]|uniref:replicative DNA helicase n=1 Tax=Pseudarthrobacter phenanthrenivorans TaxID=361575 RepID=UPI00344E89B2